MESKKSEAMIKAQALTYLIADADLSLLTWETDEAKKRVEHTVTLYSKDPLEVGNVILGRGMFNLNISAYKVISIETERRDEKVGMYHYSVTVKWSWFPFKYIAHIKMSERCSIMDKLIKKQIKTVDV